MTRNEKIYFGANCLSKLSFLLNDLSVDRIMLVTGRNSYRQSGAEVMLDSALGKREVRRFADFSANPKLEDVKKGIAVFCEFKPDIIIAIGGGSAMDIAKLISHYSINTDFIANTDKNEVSRSGNLPDHKKSQDSEVSRIPLVAIPTTAGSGSEATQFAVMYVDGQKHSISSPDILPEYVFIDPLLGMSMNSYQRAVSGLDAVCQSIESMWATGSTDESRKYAKEALRLLWNHLPEFVNGDDLEVAGYIFKGANLAGKAINITRTTACHAMSYSLTSKYGIPHGHAVGLLMMSVFKLNAATDSFNCQQGVDPEQIYKAIQSVLDAMGLKDKVDFEKAWLTFCKSIDLLMHISDILVNSDRDNVINTIVNSVNMERLNNNPRHLSSDDISNIVKESY